MFLGRAHGRIRPYNSMEGVQGCVNEALSLMWPRLYENFFFIVKRYDLQSSRAGESSDWTGEFSLRRPNFQIFGEIFGLAGGIFPKYVGGYEMFLVNFDSSLAGSQSSPPVFFTSGHLPTYLPTTSRR